MRLLRLELSGFKSFSDKTVINFIQDGISIVVGPNGCGKSNLVDAIRWTLGEQSAKHLRGSSMEDVIFNGSDSRKPVNMAQVTLVFSNPGHDTLAKYSEFTEIAVTRRLYRSGESRYLINKTACRLTDIRELFMDTGIGGKAYSIIEQGKIDQIITSRPEDRRTIIDEAAGIVKFKTKRKEAERKFAQSKQNLLRVEDILTELIKQEETLKVQVEEAEKYLNAKSRLERLKQCLEAISWSKLRNQALGISDDREKVDTTIKAYQNQLSAIETNASALSLEISLKEKALSDARTDTQHKKDQIIKLENQVKTDGIALENLDEWIYKSAEELEENNKQLLASQNQLILYRQEAETLTEEIRNKESLLENLAEREKLQGNQVKQLKQEQSELQKEEINLITSVTAAQNQISQLQERIEESESQNKVLDVKNEELDQLRQGFEVKIKEKEAYLNISLTDKEKKQQALEVQESKKEELTQRLNEIEKSINQKTLEKNQAESRYTSLEELINSHQEYDAGTQKFLTAIDQNNADQARLGFLGSLADLIEIDANYPVQVTTFLNQFFNVLVFKSTDFLAAILAYIKDLEIDNIQLFFIDKSDFEHQVSQSSIFEAVRFKPDFENRFNFTKSYKIENTSLTNIDHQQFSQDVVTITDDSAMITRDGIIKIGQTGKTNPAEQFLSRRNELDQQAILAKKCLKQIETLSEQENDIRDEIYEMDILMKSSQQFIIDIDLSILSLKKEIESKKNDLIRTEQEFKNLLSDREKRDQATKDFKIRFKELTQTIQENQKSQVLLKGKLDQLEKKADQASEDYQETTDELQHAKIVMAGLKEKVQNASTTQKKLNEDIVRYQNALEDIKNREQEIQNKKTQYQTSIENTRSLLPKELDQLNVLEASFKVANNQLETVKAELLEHQKQIQQQLGKIEALKDENHKFDVKLAQLAQEATNKEENLFTEYSITPEEILKTFDPKDFSQDKAKREINQLTEVVADMGDINLAAKKEYDALRDRLDFLQSQTDDLKQSIEALENSISKINLESKRRFLETFNKVNKQFSILFPQLFGGGEAHLELTDDESLLETGIEIIAQPPGKKLQNMTLLSGGEKALAAISLIFAIFLIKPSPFCLLDEVDAPLDDANNGRFNQHVKSMTQNSQFIIITHNKKTMEIGDSLFGVTMEEPGISKIVSVDFDSIEAEMLM